MRMTYREKKARDKRGRCGRWRCPPVDLDPGALPQGLLQHHERLLEVEVGAAGAAAHDQGHALDQWLGLTPRCRGIIKDELNRRGRRRSRRRHRRGDAAPGGCAPCRSSAARRSGLCSARAGHRSAGAGRLLGLLAVGAADLQRRRCCGDLPM